MRSPGLGARPPINQTRPVFFETANASVDLLGVRQGPWKLVWRTPLPESVELTPQQAAALSDEGVRATIWDYPEQHKLKIYAEAKWWHHAPAIPSEMPGDAQVNGTHVFLPLIHGDAPELIEQYATAFLPDGKTYVLPAGAVSGIASRAARPGEAKTASRRRSRPSPAAP